MSQDRIAVTLTTRASEDSEYKYEHRSALLKPTEFDQLVGVDGVAKDIKRASVLPAPLFDAVEVSEDVEELALNPDLVRLFFAAAECYPTRAEALEAAGLSHLADEVYELDFSENEFWELESGLVRN